VAALLACSGWYLFLIHAFRWRERAFNNRLTCFEKLLLPHRLRLRPSLAVLSGLTRDDRIPVWRAQERYFNPSLRGNLYAEGIVVHDKTPAVVSNTHEHRTVQQRVKLQDQLH
jgi:hypothetical protein